MSKDEIVLLLSRACLFSGGSNSDVVRGDDRDEGVTELEVEQREDIEQEVRVAGGPGEG